MKTLYIALLILYSTVQANNPVVQSGLDQVHEYSAWFKGKNVGIIANHTSVNASGMHIADVFQTIESCKTLALFGPEHGFKGTKSAGEKIGDTLSDKNTIPIYSLYGKNLKPSKKMLKNIDLLIFDIQDIGARFYTYIWTMALAMEAAAEAGIGFIVLDRPNPLNGRQIEGNILDPDFASFVGLYPLPVRHGLTIGELATLFNEQGWLKNGVRAKLKIIPLKNWQRELWYDETGLNFIKPSPNMPNLETAGVYPGLCLLEGSNISEGRGTQKPFLQFGAPWIHSDSLTNKLNNLSLTGVSFTPVSFTPQKIDSMSKYPKYENQTCFGSAIAVTDRNSFRAFLSGLKIIKAIHDMYPARFEWRINHFDRLCGTDLFRKEIVAFGNVDSLLQAQMKQMKSQIPLYKKQRLYNE